MDNFGATVDDSPYAGGGSVAEKLDRARTELLDLSARNRLLNMPKSTKSSKIIEIVDERSSEVFRLLVGEGKAFTFLPGLPSRKPTQSLDEDTGDDYITNDGEVILDLALPEDDVTDDRGVAGRHADTRLQTRFTPEGLQKRLMDLYYDARTLEDEQGVNVLYLTLGSLRWVDPNDKKNVRQAPLLLIPVSLERGSAGERFRLRARPEDFATNLSLENFLDRLHGIRLPETEVSDGFDIGGYLSSVEKSVEDKEGWGVEPDVVVLGFFSFAKFMMYRDLDPLNWPAEAPLISKPLLRGLLADGFAAGESLVPDDAQIDGIISPADMLHILDSDSSQTLAVHEVRNGRNLVIQGPPGTGKSQTIANLIAAAVSDGKTVLFVAEKMAALEVVKRRLDASGVGAACLELHSHKANKKAVLEDIRRTWENGAPRTSDIGSLNARLSELRDELNGHSVRMHKGDPASGLTPYQVIGQLVRLRAAGEHPNDIELEAPLAWSKDDFLKRQSILHELVDRVRLIGNPSQHVWYGVGLASATPMDVERLTKRLAAAATVSEEIDTAGANLAAMLESEAPRSRSETAPLIDLARRIAEAPLSPDALGFSGWSSSFASLERVVQSGQRLADIRQALSEQINDPAWQNKNIEVPDVLRSLASSLVDSDFNVLASLSETLPPALDAGCALARLFGEPLPETLDDLTRLVRFGGCIALAPAVSGSALSDVIWEQQPGLPGDLVADIRKYQSAKADLEGKVSDAAWSTDFSEARGILAAKGTGFLKSLSGDWRRANRLVQSCLVRRDQPLDATLAQLDRLKQGQAARAEVVRGEADGGSAFAGLWRGDRSDPAQLLKIVEWQAGLGDVGRPVRRIAAREPEREAIAKQLARLSDLSAIRKDADFVAGQFGKSADSTLAEFIDWAAELTESECATKVPFTAVPATLGERVKSLDHLNEGLSAAQTVENSSQLASAAFGPLWSGTGSDWSELKIALTWVANNVDIAVPASRVRDRGAAAALAKNIAIRCSEYESELKGIAADLKLDLNAAFGGDIGQVSTATATRRLRSWSEAGESLFQWTAYRDRAEQGRKLGCGDVVDRLEDGRLSVDQVIPSFEMAYFEAVHDKMMAAEPKLAQFDGALHSIKVTEFSEFDLRRIQVSADETVRAHHRRMPPRDGGAIGPLGVLRNELQKRRGHMPIRRLVERAGPALQALKPVFMMSPLSVAQFLAPGMVDFDLLVMDEASQIQPVDALGAVARARQVVVVGDPRQLPPTSFFARMTGGGDDDEDDGGRVTDIESILGLFTARGLPMRMLRWHYRSRHQSLIAVSNRQFYDGKLFVVPSPYTAEAGMGLSFHHIKDGIFDAGGKRCNTVDAKAVARAIIQHALDHSHLTLGVAAFSVAQRRAILDELELLRRAHPETEGFFQSHPSEPFFVKNLENVQGDERDVIFISVGYGPTVPGGRVPMRFGPLGSEGGERRLNVLISRAKQRCEVFSSMTDEDIEPDFAQSRKGVFAFRLFLQFARTGRLTMAEATGRDLDSVFEEQVANALHQCGFHVHRQVGLAGFFIDLAVSDPERPGRYLLGIECDGDAYHSALSARDRDRLRQSVLESHGWQIHRIWSTDWFQRPQQELARVIAAIEAAKAEDAAREVNRHKPVVRITSEEFGDLTLMGVETGEEASADRVKPPPLNYYVEAELERSPHHVGELHELPRGMLVGYVERVAEVEGPVHFDEVVTRIRESWGLKRAGARIREAVAAATEVAVGKRTIIGVGDFISIEGRLPVLRDRSGVNSTGLRKPEAIPLDEVAAGAVVLSGMNFGASADQLVTEIARGLGFKATSDVLRRQILDGIDLAKTDGRLVEQNGLLQNATAKSEVGDDFKDGI